jgi:L-asparaginase / beta-aspartyl-peptidase
MLSLVVHGGAWQIPDGEIEDHRAGLNAAMARGIELLQEGRAAIDVVVETVALLEDDPTFDAGRGSVLNLAGRIEMDASVMDGSTLRAGCVACVSDVLNPIRLARAILDDGRAVMLAGEGASAFARAAGITACRMEDLLIHRESRRKGFLDSLPDYKTRRPFDGSLPLDHGEGPPAPPPPQPLGTVGAVCCDSHGRLAAATSTGGAPNTLPGRVGDSPVLGAGTWAEDGVGAAGSTGWGEAILLDLLAFRAVQEIDTVTIAWKEPRTRIILPHPIATERITWGPASSGTASASTADAARSAIRGFARRTGGAGGVILIGPDGSPGFAFNTPRMARGFWVEGMGDPYLETEPAL